MHQSIFFLDDILVFTVATEYTDGFQRYLHTAAEYGIKPEVLGMGEKWQGGDNIRLEAGGGWKVNLLKQALEKYKDDEEKIILFTDGLVFNSFLRRDKKCIDFINIFVDMM